jgi:hypothetical protein
MIELRRDQTSKFSFSCLLCCCLIAIHCSVASAETLPPTAPEQPAQGPGGKDYRHAELKISTFGQGELKFWLFEPAGPRPTR